MMAVDVGGTFTDIVAVNEGKILTAKVATNSADVEESVISGAAEIGAENSTIFNHASTHGLNAIITRSLPKIGFLTTEGHRDIPDIGRAWRPANAVTDPLWRRSFGDSATPLVERYLRRGVYERIRSDGEIHLALDEKQAIKQIKVLKKCDVEGVAICLLNSYINNAHELRLQELVADILGDVPCSISSEVSPLTKEYARASTSIVDVYMKIIYADYTTRLKSGLQKIGFSGQLNFADCAATLIPAEIAMKTPFRIVFAGPAAGTVGSAHFGSLITENNLLCADIGGTSCDISLVTNGEPFVNTTFELEHDLVVNALSNDITSIGAGGGSLIAVSATGSITVGPGSAGAEPGPACYGRGGTQPTMTDICIMIGLIDPEGFAGGKMSLDPKLSETSIKNLNTPLSFEQRVQYSFDIGLNNIAEGVFNIAIKNGIDPRDYSLMAFGAAGPLLLPSIAKNIQVKRVIVPPHPGLFSALGLLSADQAFISNRSSYTILSEENADAIETIYCEMEGDLKDDLNLNASTIFVRTFDAQLVGQTWETPFIEVPAGNITASSITGMVENFHRVYKERNGNRFDEISVQGVTYRVKAIIPTDKVDFPQLKKRTIGKAQPIGTTIIRYLSDVDYIAEIYDRESLFAGDTFSGPVIIREALSTTYIPREMTGVIGLFGEIIIESDEETVNVD